MELHILWGVKLEGGSLVYLCVNVTSKLLHVCVYPLYVVICRLNYSYAMHFVGHMILIVNYTYN